MSPTMEALLEQGLRRRAEADELARAGRPRRLRHADGRRLMVSPDLETAGQWRLTSFDRLGEPWGHTCHRNAAEAFFDALTWGGFTLEP